jgi:hypothetical protein
MQIAVAADDVGIASPNPNEIIEDSEQYKT